MCNLHRNRPVFHQREPRIRELLCRQGRRRWTPLTDLIREQFVDSQIPRIGGQLQRRIMMLRLAWCKCKPRNISNGIKLSFYLLLPQYPQTLNIPHMLKIIHLILIIISKNRIFHFHFLWQDMIIQTLIRYKETPPTTN